MVAVLQNIRSSHNVGSIFRTADAAGITKLYLCGITPAPIDRFSRENTNLTKVSLGAEHSVSWEKVKSIVSLIRDLKSDGFVIYAIEQSKQSMPFHKMEQIEDHSNVALIVGDEVRGISQSILHVVHHIIEIPMHGKKESLNVAVAFGIVVFRFLYP